MDPLSLLREYVTAGRVNEIAQAGDRVDFGGRFTFSKNVATGYKSQQVGAEQHTCIADGAPCSRPRQPSACAARPRSAASVVCSPLPSMQGKGAFYDLETLVYFVKNMDATFREYLQRATKELGKGKAVSFIDRKARWPRGPPLTRLWRPVLAAATTTQACLA